jgi:hypothetical protein
MQFSEQSESAQLDELIAKLKRTGQNDLLIEHLQTAHAYLHGAMPEECAHNLEMAREASGALPVKSLAGEVQHTIDGLLHDLHPFPPAHWRHHTGLSSRGPRATAQGLTEFFHGSDLSLGIFYPKKHVVAVFHSYAAAQSAHEILSANGFRLWEVISIPGSEVEEFIEQTREHHSLWADLMMQFSRLLDTEAGLVDRYRRWARRGAAFLVAYSPTEEQAEGICELLEPLDPAAVHWFAAGYIRHLV